MSGGLRKSLYESGMSDEVWSRMVSVQGVYDMQLNLLLTTPNSKDKQKSLDTNAS